MSGTELLVYTILSLPFSWVIGTLLGYRIAVYRQERFDQAIRFVTNEFTPGEQSWEGVVAIHYIQLVFHDISRSRFSYILRLARESAPDRHDEINAAIYRVYQIFQPRTVVERVIDRLFRPFEFKDREARKANPHG